MTQARESRPSSDTEAATQRTLITHGEHTGLSRAEAINRVTGAYAVVVAGKTIRRHLYLNLPSAERAVQRAEARGHTAHMILVRLTPIDHTGAVTAP